MSGDPETDSKLDARDDRRLFRWPAVMASLGTALIAVAMGNWWLATGSVILAGGLAIWALRS